MNSLPYSSKNNNDSLSSPAKMEELFDLSIFLRSKFQQHHHRRSRNNNGQQKRRIPSCCFDIVVDNAKSPSDDLMDRVLGGSNEASTTGCLSSSSSSTSLKSNSNSNSSCCTPRTTTRKEGLSSMFQHQYQYQHKDTRWEACSSPNTATCLTLSPVIRSTDYNDGDDVMFVTSMVDIPPLDVNNSTTSSRSPLASRTRK